ncbi:MAG: tRNA (adenosine(37)-N6)-threonylcarbamoyltransferase complex dimerization subunit type 1 TsaB [Firmicutes bacterium]|nr:tRNA (adenosine(37)-N6)-threonylcarbamoyltransferase complex dimerization subunit type 1 TsaB [Bacillota bacterium]
MNLLAFDSSTPVGSVAVLSGGEVKAELTLSVQRTHSEHLMPAVEEVVAASGLNLEQLDALAVGTGPGSYTGIRIALGTAMGIGYALNLPVVGIPTLDTLAMAVWPAPGVVVSLLDARRNEVYCGIYRTKPRPPYLIQQEEPAVEKLTSLPQKVQGEPVTFVGPGALLHQETLEELFGDRASIVPSGLAYPQAGRLGLLAEARIGDAVSVFALKPLYLRRPYVK